MIQVELGPEMEARVRDHVQVRGISVEQLILELLKTEAESQGQLASTQDSMSSIRSQAVAAAIDRIRSLRKGNSLEGITAKELVEEGRHV